MDLDQRQTVYAETEDATYNHSFHKLMRMFAISVLIAFIGTAIGTEVPPALFLPLMVIEIVMLIASFFITRRGKPIGYGFTFTFCFISGITIYPAIAYYLNTGGQGMVLSAFALTVIIFGSLSVYAYYSKRDFTFLRGFLLTGLIALILLSLFGIFFGGLHSGPVGLAIAFAGIMIFSGFVLYDVSQYRNGIADEYIPLAVLGLYLTFINLFLYLLRFLSILNDD